MEAEPGDTIICRYCHAELAATADNCNQCGAATTNNTAASGRSQAKELMNRPWVIVLLMLHVGILGMPVYWMTKYSLSTRLLMTLASLVYTIAAVTYIIWTIDWLASMFFGS